MTTRTLHSDLVMTRGAAFGIACVMVVGLTVHDACRAR
jgi:hypothetical protein